MFFLFYIFIFLFGLAVGSFLNVLIDRLPEKKSIKGRSYCPHCKHPLGWQDLIPVLSFFWLEGRCRYCKKSISIQYPIVEVATGAFFILVIYHIWGLEIGNLLITVYWLLITSILIVIFVADLKYYIIPNKIIYPAILISLLALSLSAFQQEGVSTLASWLIAYGLMAAILASGFFLALVFISKGRWMGLGDVKLAFFMGLVLSWPGILVALFLAFLSGSIVGLGLVAAGKKKMKSQIPFGTFLAASTFLAMFYGERMINWYLDLIWV